MILLLVLLLAVIALVVAYLVFLLVTSAIVFARVAFGLAMALMLQQTSGLLLVPGSGFLNYVAWAVICLGLIFLLSSLPQVDLALRFSCTVIVSVFLVFFVSYLFGGLFSSIAGKTFTISTLFEIVIKLVCLGLAVWAMLFQNKKSYDAPKNPLIRLAERVLASLVFGLAITFLFPSLNNNWPLSDIVLLLIFAGSSVAVFFALPKIMELVFAPSVDPTEVSMPK